ncbi:MAG: preprotein translocase subunit SecY [Patescibacteria group bacterium]
MWNKIKIIFRDKDLRKKILFVLLILFLFRVGANITIPGVDLERLSKFMSSGFFGFLSIISGSGLSNLSIMMLGVAPYITATIIMQLLTMMFPKLKEMYHEEGEAGKQKFNQYSRLFTVPLAALQAFGLLSMLASKGVLVNLTLYDKIVNIIIIIAGSVLLMWLGELISEYGIGNGVSLIIFAGIVSSIPSAVYRLFTLQFYLSQIPMYLGVLIAIVFIVAGVVVVTEAERPIPISYAKRIRGTRMYGGSSTYLPLRINQAGVIPIIFALSILLFPQMILNFLDGFQGNNIINAISGIFQSFINNIYIYGTFYFVLVFLFTYFYTAVTFDPNAIATNLQKSGAFIPGIRPGKSTAEYISKILNKITFFGAMFLGVIAVLPFVMQGITQNPLFAIGGTALLIVVSVVLELVKQTESQIVMREYE